MNTIKIIKAHYSSIGRKGGRAKKRKYGKKVFSEMGKKGAAKRWNKAVDN